MKIATELSHEGRISLAEFLIKNFSEKMLKEFLSLWEYDVRFDDNCQEGFLELKGQYTRTKNPTTIHFSGDELIFEEVEVDEED